MFAGKEELQKAWKAAHFPKNLKKSDYADVHIPTITKNISDELPKNLDEADEADEADEGKLRLGMAAHLLLGVVQILNKKMELLRKDSMEISIAVSRSFDPGHVLLENGRKIPRESVTYPKPFIMPETFDLDSLDICHIIDSFRENDPHTTSQEQITLPDSYVPPIPNPYGEYGNATFNEDSEPMQGIEDSEPMQGIEDSEPMLGIEDSEPMPFNEDPEPIHINETHQGQEVDQIIGEQAMGEQGNKPLEEKIDPSTAMMIDNPGDAADERQGYDRQRMEQDQRQGMGYEKNKRKKRRCIMDDPVIIPARIMEENLRDTRSIRRKRKDVTVPSEPKMSLRRMMRRLMPELCKELSNVYNVEYVRSKLNSKKNNREGVINDSLDVEHEGVLVDENERANDDELDADDNDNYYDYAEQGDVQNMESLENVVGAPSVPNIPLVGAEQGAAQNMESLENVVGAPSVPNIPLVGAEQGAAQNMESLENVVGAPSVPNIPLADLVPNIENVAAADVVPIAVGPQNSWSVDNYMMDYCLHNPNPGVPAEEFSFNQLLDGKSRNTAAQSFLQLCRLETESLIHVTQREPFGDCRFKLIVTPAAFIKGLTKIRGALNAQNR